MWYDQYRPKTLDEYIWVDENCRKSIMDWVAAPLDHTSLLLAGPTGTGKTTLARLISKQLDLGGDAKFIPASLRSGVDTIRDEIVGFCESGGFGDLKLIILDEAERLSRDAQEMMRNVIDRYNGDVRFIFTVNDPSRIIQPILGRFWLCPVDAPDEDAFVLRLTEILTAEKVEWDNASGHEALGKIVVGWYPNMRRAITDMQMSVVDGVLTTETKQSGDLKDSILNAVHAPLPVSEIRTIATGMKHAEFESAYRALYDNSHTFQNEAGAVKIIAEFLHRHVSASFPDITLTACIINLIDSETGNE